MTRSEEFGDGAESVRTPKFESIQQQGIRNYEATSVLDNLRPNQNGLGEQDLQRTMMGVKQSYAGTAQSTADQKLWLKHREPSLKTKNLDREG